MRRLLIASFVIVLVAALAPVSSAQDVDLRSPASAASMSGVLTPALSGDADHHGLRNDRLAQHHRQAGG